MDDIMSGGDDIESAACPRDPTLDPAAEAAFSRAADHVEAAAMGGDVRLSDQASLGGQGTYLQSMWVR